MRLLFFPTALRDDGSARARRKRTVSEIKHELPYETPNTGNIVHLEALRRMLRHHDPLGNGTARLAGLEADDMSGVDIDPFYDGIVIQKSNLIRSYDHLGADEQSRLLSKRRREAEWLAKSRLPIFVFGVGIQNALPPRPDAVAAPLFDLLKLYNDRAEIFAVRGEATAAWLHSVGLKKAVALGCPSLFLNPVETSRIATPAIHPRMRLASAGHLQRSAFPHRLEPINRIGACFPTDYVFQNDFFAFFRRFGELKVYDEQTNVVDVGIVRGLAKESIGIDLSFENYFLFLQADPWRNFAATRDVYFGDRFHGGVVFLQSGRPAVLVCNDARVADMADFMAIPVVQNEELKDGDPANILKSKLSEASLSPFRAKYRERLRAFRNAVMKVGLELTNEAAFAEALNGR